MSFQELKILLEQFAVNDGSAFDEQIMHELYELGDLCNSLADNLNNKLEFYTRVNYD
jgi:hypothetical protein